MTGDDDSVKAGPFTLTPTLSPFGGACPELAEGLRAGIKGEGSLVLPPPAGGS